LDYLVDDTPQDCVDVLSESTTRSILLVDRKDPLSASSARRLGICVAHSIHEVLDVLVQRQRHGRTLRCLKNCGRWSGGNKKLKTRN
jgi:hypothetical protein